MTQDHNWRGRRMREAMDIVGLSSGQVAVRMGVTGGAVRGWTTGRRKIGLEEMEKFAMVVGLPVEYFMKPEASLPHGTTPSELQKAAGRHFFMAEVPQDEETADRVRERITRYLIEKKGMSNEEVDRIWDEMDD